MENRTIYENGLCKSLMHNVRFSYPPALSYDSVRPVEHEWTGWEFPEDSKEGARRQEGG
jgi:hypothetical protein